MPSHTRVVVPFHALHQILPCRGRLRDQVHRSRRRHTPSVNPDSNTQHLPNPNTLRTNTTFPNTVQRYNTRTPPTLLQHSISPTKNGYKRYSAPSCITPEPSTQQCSQPSEASPPNRQTQQRKQWRPSPKYSTTAPRTQTPPCDTKKATWYFTPTAMPPTSQHQKEGHERRDISISATNQPIPTKHHQKQNHRQHITAPSLSLPKSSARSSHQQRKPNSRRSSTMEKKLARSERP